MSSHKKLNNIFFNHIMSLIRRQGINKNVPPYIDYFIWRNKYTVARTTDNSWYVLMESDMWTQAHNYTRFKPLLQQYEEFIIKETEIHNNAIKTILYLGQMTIYLNADIISVIKQYIRIGP